MIPMYLIEIRINDVVPEVLQPVLHCIGSVRIHISSPMPALHPHFPRCLSLDVLFLSVQALAVVRHKQDILPLAANGNWVLFPGNEALMSHKTFYRVFGNHRLQRGNACHIISLLHAHVACHPLSFVCTFAIDTPSA